MSRQKSDLAAIADELKQATLNIVDSYSQEDIIIQQLNNCRLPSREKIIAILNAVQELIFPGYFGALGLTRSSVSARAHSLVCTIFEDLSDQIRLCLLLDSRSGEAELQKQAEMRALDFINSIPHMRRILSLDVQAAFDGDPAAYSYDEIIFSYPGLFAVMIFRIAHTLATLDVPLIPRIMTEYAHSLTGIDIHPHAQIGHSFFIDHGSGVVIGETTVIGNHVKLYQGVTLGALSFQKHEGGALVRGKKRHPTIEDQVIIYSGATILGGSTVIGEGSIIGGNVWLTHSVPPRTKVTIDEPQIRISQTPLPTGLP